MINQTKVGKHALRITIGVLGGLGAIYIDNVAAKSDRAMIQMALWTFVLFAYSIVELRQSLRRTVQMYIALALAGLHFLFLVVIRNMFPFQNSLFIVPWLLIEGLVLVFLYARIGQSLDPTGPFGLTEEERRKRAARNLE